MTPAEPPMGAGAQVDVRDVVVSFAGARGERFVALDRVRLTVHPGEIVALIGPNGSGKSTLLRVVAGLLRPDRGDALLDGKPIEEPSPRIGLVFQEPRLLPWRSAEANVAYPLELAGVPPSERTARVQRVLAAVGLDRARTLLPRELSGGMRQRAALARTLALEPRVLLLDEPFSALDELTRERLNGELLALAAQTQMTLLVVTHSVQEAIFLSDRVIVLSPSPGRVVADIRVELARPRSLAALDAALVGETAARIRAHLVDPVAEGAAA